MEKEKLIIQKTYYGREKILCPKNLERQETIQKESPYGLVDSLIFLIEKSIIDAEYYTFLDENGEEIHPKKPLKPNSEKEKAFVFIDDNGTFGYVGFPKGFATDYYGDETGDLVEVMKFLIKYGYEESKNFTLIYGSEIFRMIKED